MLYINLKQQGEIHVSEPNTTLKQLLLQLSIQSFAGETKLGNDLTQQGFPPVLAEFDEVASESSFENLWSDHSTILEAAKGLPAAIQQILN